MSKRKPQGEIKIIKIIGNKPHPSSVSGTVICEDGVGDLWEFPAAYLTWDLKPHNPYPKFRLRDVDDLLKDPEPIKVGDLILGSVADFLLGPGDGKIRHPQKDSYQPHQWSIGYIESFSQEGAQIKKLESSPGWSWSTVKFAAKIDEAIANELITRLQAITSEDEDFDIAVCKTMLELGLTKEGEQK